MNGVEAYRREQERKAKEAREEGMRRANEIIEQNERAKRIQEQARKGESDGLQMIVHHDETGREIRNFVSMTGRKDWMDQFRDKGVRIDRFVKNWPGGADLSAMHVITQDGMGNVVGEFDRRLVRMQEGKK
jgi:hypothetical protein